MARWNVVRVGSLLGGAAAALTSTAASICCIGPLAITLLGVNGAILAAGVKPYQPYLLVASLLFIGFAYWAIYGRRKASEEDAQCSVRSGRIAKTVLWIASALWLAAVVIGFAADRYWL
jgi:hypothetical protein